MSLYSGAALLACLHCRFLPSSRRRSRDAHGVPQWLEWSCSRSWMPGVQSTLGSCSVSWENAERHHLCPAHSREIGRPVGPVPTPGIGCWDGGFSHAQGCQSGRGGVVWVSLLVLPRVASSTVLLLPVMPGSQMFPEARQCGSKTRRL